MPWTRSTRLVVQVADRVMRLRFDLAFGSSHHSTGESSFTNRIHIVVFCLVREGWADYDLMHKSRNRERRRVL
jgi:hypothetical protein